MLERMRHRGPDGGEVRRGDGWWLGTQRLAIVAPDASPMTGTIDGDAQLWLAGDGQIYNHRRIRDRLGLEADGGARGDVSDLDAALRLFVREGAGAFEQLWGAFALVIAGSDGRFAAARDVLGIAPLYWARRGETVLFASELKAFDEDWRADVEPFPPGHVWTPGTGLVEGPALPGSGPVLLASRDPREDPPEWVFDALRETLVRAVSQSLDVAAPAGVLLSGGVDSSIVTAIAARIVRERGSCLPSFAVGMAGSRDLLAAREVAEHVGTDHHELIYTAEDAIALVPRVISELESFDPTLVHSAVPHHLVAELAAEHVEVVLAGEGADELFAGYTHFGLHESGDELHGELVETLAGMHIGGLQRVDRVAAAHGVEPRMPFLDLDFVELAMAIPPEWKMLREGRPAKWLLRRAFDGWLPDGVLWRRKEQFGQGTGMNTVLREHYGALVEAEDLQRESSRVAPPLRTREELAYYRIFAAALPGIDAARNVGRFIEA
ncbi:asparagine synthase-related protein [Leucobacter weissii]|nr:asparagine synthase-related protein [Leucobacter weissii]